MVTRFTSFIVLFCLTFSAGLAPADDWPNFRGPHGGAVSAERGFPVTWGDGQNVVWKARLPGPGSSSPVVQGGRVYVTSFSGYGADDRADPAKLRRHLVCLDEASGRQLWKSDVAAVLPELEWGMAVGQHGYATSTPAVDDERAYAYFGKSGVFAYNHEGKQLWHADVGELLNNFGSGASPTLHGNLVIVNATVEGSRLVALDKVTGKAVWKARLPGDSWTTPVVVAVPGGKKELVVATRTRLFGFEPESGQQLWQMEWVGADYASPSPVARGDVFYVMGSGNAGRTFLAVRAGGRGDVAETHVVWKRNLGASFCSPILVGDYLYFFSGMATCLRADTGEVVFQERLPGLGNEYASPAAADGKIYLFTRRGDGHVLAARGKWEPLAKNTLSDAREFVASPALSGGRIYVRSGDLLYCLGEAKR